MERTDDDTWDLATTVGATATMVAAGRARATNAPESHAAVMLESMKKIVESVPGDVTSPQRIVVEEELAAATASIKGRLARFQEGYAIAAGPEHGQYLRFAQALTAAGIH